MIIVNYEHPTENGKTATRRCICNTKKEADIVCRILKAKETQGYKIIDVYEN